MKDLNFRKTALKKEGSFKPAKEKCVIVMPVPQKKGKK